MKRFSQQLHKESQSVKLQAVEQRELRERIVAYMEYHPLPNSQTAKTPKIAESFRVIPFSYFAKAGAAVAVLLLVIVPVLAEQAIPGDNLYAIKVSFNEEVRSTLAMSAHQKIEWETELLNRRIAEARLLASEGRLTDEVEAKVALAVKTHTENAKREIEQLRTTDAEEASLEAIELATTLEVQSASLKDEETNGSDDSTLADAITESLNESRPVETPSFDRLLARVEANTTRVHELLKTLKLPESSANHKDIVRRIEDVERSVEEAITQRNISDEGARMMLVETLQGTQKLIVFMTEFRAGQKFEVEDFVPVKLTPAEQATKKAEFEEDISKQLSEIESMVTLSTEPLVTEKASVALTTMSELQASLASSTDFTVTTDLYTEFTNLAADTKTLLTSVVNDQATTTDPVVEESSATTTNETELTDPIEENTDTTGE